MTPPRRRGYVFNQYSSTVSSCIREQALTFSGQWEIEDMQGVEAENTAYNVGVCTCHFTRKWKNLAGVPCSEAP